jgi:hypothetical protein
VKDGETGSGREVAAVMEEKIDDGGKDIAESANERIGHTNGDDKVRGRRCEESI